MNNSAEPNGAAPSAGQIVGGGHYSLHVPLGGSGLLWLAQDEELQRLAVVRFFPPDLRRDARALEQLRQRVQALVPVAHENLCRTLEWYDAAGMEPFVASEYIEGQPLLAALNAKPGPGIPWSTLKAVVASLACGLEALHRAGVIHHGVQPENIFFAADKRVKLLNPVVFGMFKNPLFVPTALAQPLDLRCFSPQQLSGQEPSVADDFYSLGATIYELLTGAPVFANPPTLLQDIQTANPPSLAERLVAACPGHDVPEPVISFVMACLNKEASQRPTSFEALLPRREQAIPVQPHSAAGPEEKIIPLAARVEPAEILSRTPVRSELELIRRARDSRPRGSSLGWAIAACLLLLLGAGGAWGFLQHLRQQEKEAELTAAMRQELQRRQLSEQAALEATERQQQEAAARKKSEEEARQAKEAARLAQAKQRAEAEALARREREQVAASPKPAQPADKPWVMPPMPATATDGFLSMFNGRDLTDWSGDTNYWSVRDGFITAQSRADDPKQRHLLTWTKGNVGDFEMHFSYRFRLLRGNKSPNGGVNYRQTGTTNFTCYQYDLVTNPKDNGSVTDDRRRYRLAGFGEAVTATSSNKHQVMATLGDTNALQAVKPEDWNKCVIIAKGDRLTHYINGVLVADVTDNSKSKRHMSGAIALELYTRNTNNCATFLQFGDLKLKRLGPEPKSPGSGLVSTGK